MNFFKKVWQFIYQYMGIGYIIWMIHPPIDTRGKRRPSNFLLWVVGLHVGLLGIAYQHYQNAVSRWHNNYNVLIERLGDDYNSAILQLINDKKYELIPVEPHLLDISSVYRNFNEDWNEPYSDIQIDVDKLLSLYIPNQPGEYKNLQLDNKPLIFDRPGYFNLSESRIERMDVHSAANFQIKQTMIDSLRIIDSQYDLEFQQSELHHISIENSYGSLNLDVKDQMKFSLFANNSLLKDSKLSLDSLTDTKLNSNILMSTIIELNYLEAKNISDNFFYKCVFMNPAVFEQLKAQNYFYQCFIIDSIPRYESSKIDVSEFEIVSNRKDFTSTYNSWQFSEIEGDSMKISYFKL